MAWGPAKEAPGARRIGDKTGRIAVAAGASAVRHLGPQSAPDCCDDLGDRATFTGSDVHSLECSARHLDGKRRDMSSSKVRYVDVVTEAGPIGGIEILAKDNERFAVAKRCGDCQRQQVCFGIMSLSDYTRWIRAGGVKITQGDSAKTIGAALRSDHPFSREFGVPIGTGGCLFSRLRDQFVRAAATLAVNRCA